MTGGSPWTGRLAISLALLAVLGLGWPARAEIRFVPTLGDPAPPLEVERLLQAPITSLAGGEELRDHVVVLEFWATWCAPCVAAIPHLNDLVGAFAGEPIRFLSITTERIEHVQGFMQEVPIAGWVGIDPDQSTFDAFGVTTIPRTLVLDRQGRLALDTRASLLTEELLRRVLAGEEIAAPEVERLQVTAAGGGRGEVSFEPAAGAEPYWFVSGDMLLAEGVDLRRAVAIAHGVPAGQVVLPPGLEVEPFTVSVRQTGADEALLRQILGGALTREYGLALRREEQPVEVLVVSGGDLRSSSRRSSRFEEAPGRWRADGAAVSLLFEFVERRTGWPVLDETGLDGRFTWEVTWTPGDRDGLVSALRDQLGMSVERQQRTLPTVIVEPLPDS